MADVSWASLLEDTEFDAYRAMRKSIRTLSNDGMSRVDAVYAATRQNPPGKPPAEYLDAENSAKRTDRYRSAFLEGRERAVLEFLTGKDDTPGWVPDIPAEDAGADAIVRPVLSNFLARNGIFVTFILNDGLKWTVNCDRGTLTYRLLRVPTDATPGAYTINTSFILDTTPLEQFLMHRLHVHH